MPSNEHDHYCWDMLRITGYFFDFMGDDKGAESKLTLNLRCNLCHHFYEMRIQEPSIEQSELALRFHKDGTIVNFQSTPEGSIRLMDNKIAPPRLCFEFDPKASTVEVDQRHA